MTEFMQLIGLSPELGIALAVTLAMFALVIMGRLVVKQHLEDWKSYAQHHQQRADRLEAALTHRAEVDREFSKALEQLNLNMATLLADRRR